MKGGGVVWMNGGLLPTDESRLDPRDRGFTLGDGLFETMRAREGDVVRMARHLSRLREGAAVIGLSPLPNDGELADAVAGTLAANGLTEAAVRLTVSRGVPGRRGLLPDPDPQPSVVVRAEPFVGYPAGLYDRGLRAVTGRVPRNERSPLARVKSLSYLDNVLARREAEVRGADDALLLNTRGDVACASAANLFLLLDGALITPSVASGALPGTVRGLLLTELAPRMGFDVTERPVRPGELAAAEEAFLTNALLGIAPMTEVDGESIGTGTPGPVSLDLRAGLEGSTTR